MIEILIAMLHDAEKLITKQEDDMKTQLSQVNNELLHIDKLLSNRNNNY